MTKSNNLYRPCPSCGGDVHQKSAACKKCGAPSPWPQAPVENLGLSQAPKVTVEPNQNRPHVVLRQFEQMVGDVLVKLKEGAVITDFNLINRLKVARAPIVELGLEKNLCVCPNCSHIFATAGNSGSSAA